MKAVPIVLCACMSVLFITVRIFEKADTRAPEPLLFTYRQFIMVTTIMMKNVAWNLLHVDMDGMILIMDGRDVCMFILLS